MTRRVIVVGLVALGVVTLLSGLWLVQRRLIYFPTGDPGPPPSGWDEELVETDDGLALALWHRPSDGREVLVVVFPGNAGNRRDRVALGNRLAGAGFGVVLAEYRGYGGNPGSPTEDGLALDARAITDWARREYAGVPMLLFGESLGAAVAVGEAVRGAPEGMVLRSPFTSLADAASANYFGIPAGWFLRDAYPTLDRIRTLEVPVTVVAGTDDSIVPIAQSFRVYDEAAQPLEWLPIDGADHNDAVLTSGPDVVGAVSRLADHLDG